MKQRKGAPAPIITNEPQWLKGSGVVRGHATATIQRSADELYKMMRDVESSPLWMERMVRVVETGPTTSTWTMQVTDDKQISWNSEIVSDVPGEKIAWRSVARKKDVNDESDAESVDMAGECVFREPENGRGTEVLLVMETRIPGGKVANALTAVAERGQRQREIENLRHFKALAETGELPTTKGQPHGPRGMSGSIKEIMYGENNPEPPGSRDETPEEAATSKPTDTDSVTRKKKIA
jgi:uncharacterized membrane protein